MQQQIPSGNDSQRGNSNGDRNRNCNSTGFVFRGGSIFFGVLAGTVWVWFTFGMSNVDSRRDFLRIAPLAAAVSVALPDTLFAAEAPAPPAMNPVPFQVFKAETLAASETTLMAMPGTKSLIDVKELPVTVVMTTETAKAAKEFEWHEGRDHVVQILDGSTMYELGGIPKNGRNTKAGEWLAPESEGSSKVMLSKGDMLLIPRSTPHKRTTTGSVTILLISTVGTVAS